MSDSGFWGYIGIVAGLVLMLAVCLFYIVFSYGTDETSTTKGPPPTPNTRLRKRLPTRHKTQTMPVFLSPFYAR